MRPFVPRLAVIFVALLTSTGGGASAQSFDDGFPFFMPPDDSSTADYLPHFPARPITEADRIYIESDRFIRADKSIRFFGANLVADGAFPSPTDANHAVGRMRKLGLNLIRFHHLDNPWSSRAIFPRNGSTRELDDDSLRRLEYLIFRLKSEGIYVNMNLHVSRTFTEADGVVDADQIPEYGKGVTLFDPTLIKLQKEYARQLLTHENPFTGMTLAEDPVLAMVEITNENSLYYMWRNGDLRRLEEGGALPDHYADQLDVLWNEFLTDRYGTTDAVREAWSSGAATEGPQLIQNGGFETAIGHPWQLEQHGGGVANFQRDAGEAYDGSASARITISQTGPNDWNVQWKQVDLSFREDSTYTVTFAMRAEAARTITVFMSKNVDPWTTWQSYNAPVTQEWHTHRFSFRAPESASGDMRLSFIVGGEEGSVWVDDVSLRRAGRSGLEEGESLEDGTIERIELTDALSYSDQRLEDMTAFYIQLQDEYFAEMRDFLKNDLGVTAPITGTNWNFGLVDLAVQSKLDYVDNHSYWDHPQFPGQPWSPTDWLINNTPMVRNVEAATIPRLTAGVPAAGKPFTISEYNHAFPNRYQTEAVLFLTAYSAFHGADGLMFFEYNGGTNWTADRIDGFFTLHRNPAMTALMPSAAYAYRKGLIREAETTLEARYAREDVLQYPAVGGGSWEGASLFPRTLALEHAVVSGSFDAGETNVAAFPAPSGSPYVSDTDEIRWDADGLLTVAAPRFEAATGFFDAFGGTPIGTSTLEGGSGFATYTWVSLTDAALAEARRSLITLSTTAQNTNMQWDGTQTVNDDWGTSPVVVRPVKIDLILDVGADSLRVFPLDATGEADSFRSYVPVNGRFELTIDQHAAPTLWYGIEAFGDGSSTGIGDGSASGFRLDSIYPNPASETARVVVATGVPSEIRLEVYDTLGRRVNRVARDAPEGRQVFDLDVSTLAAGVYHVRVSAGESSAIEPLVVR